MIETLLKLLLFACTLFAAGLFLLGASTGYIDISASWLHQLGNLALATYGISIIGASSSVAYQIIISRYPNFFRQIEALIDEELRQDEVHHFINDQAFRHQPGRHQVRREQQLIHHAHGQLQLRARPPIAIEDISDSPPCPPKPVPYKPVKSFQQRLEAIGYEGDTPWDCPISHSIMNNPVTVASGQTYDLDSLQQWFRQNDNPAMLACPMNHTKLISVQELCTNIMIKRLIEQFVSEQEASKKLTQNPNRFFTDSPKPSSPSAIPVERKSPDGP